MLCSRNHYEMTTSIILVFPGNQYPNSQGRPPKAMKVGVCTPTDKVPEIRQFQVYGTKNNKKK